MTFRLKSGLFGALFFGILLGTILVGTEYAHAETVTSSVTIGETCGIQFVAEGATISYGQILPGDTTAEQVFTVINPGNVPAQIKVSGTNWLDDSDGTVMNADSTRYSVTMGDYSSKTALDTTANTIISTLEPQTNTETFWQLEANLLDVTFSGSLSQTLDFSSSC